MFAQVANVCEREVGGTNRNLEIDFDVADDHEIFSTTADFLDRVSSEALTKFNTVHIRARGDVEVDVTFRRHGLTGPRVFAQVIGTDQDVVERASRAVTTSVKRGDVVRGLRVWGVFGAGAVYGLLLVLGVVYLVGDIGWLPFSILLVVNSIIAGLLGPNIYPNVEVALPGKTRLARAFKAAAALAIPVATAAIGKAFFGGSG